jgi:hypothetical protein
LKGLESIDLEAGQLYDRFPPPPGYRREAFAAGVQYENLTTFSLIATFVRSPFSIVSQNFSREFLAKAPNLRSLTLKCIKFNTQDGGLDWSPCLKLKYLELYLVRFADLATGHCSSYPKSLETLITIYANESAFCVPYHSSDIGLPNLTTLCYIQSSRDIKPLEMLLSGSELVHQIIPTNRRVLVPLCRAEEAGSKLQTFVLRRDESVWDHLPGESNYEAGNFESILSHPRLSDVRSLELKSKAIFDETLEFLCLHMRKVQHLTLSSTRVTDLGLKKFVASQEKLEKLTLFSCRVVTKDLIAWGEVNGVRVEIEM